MGYKNKEGYSDYTAEIAIGRVSKKERNERMAKKRSCRRTEEENILHEKAVKIRKMTDEQINEFMDDAVKKAKFEGFEAGNKRGYTLGYLEKSNETPTAVSKLQEFLESLSNNKVHGIGKTTIEKLKTYAKEGGFVE